MKQPTAEELEHLVGEIRKVSKSPGAELRWWQHLIARVELYRFPIRLHVTIGIAPSWGGPTLNLRMDTNDRDDGHQMSVTSVHTCPEMIDERDALAWIRSRIGWFLLHELDEHFRCDGKRVNEPHPERK